MRKSLYLLTTTPTSYTHTFHPLSTIVIHTFNFAQVESMDDNCREWVECMGVVSRRRVWLVEVGGIYGCGYWCGCKEVYRFPHTTYPYSSCICSFLQQHPYFLFFFKERFSFLFQYFLVIKFYELNNFFTQYKHTGASHSSHMKAAHNVLYTKKHT